MFGVGKRRVQKARATQEELGQKVVSFFLGAEDMIHLPFPWIHNCMLMVLVLKLDMLHVCYLFLQCDPMALCNYKKLISGMRIPPDVWKTIWSRVYKSSIKKLPIQSLCIDTILLNCSTLYFRIPAAYAGAVVPRWLCLSVLDVFGIGFLY